MSYLPQAYRSNKRLAQLIKQEPVNPKPQQKAAQTTTSLIQTRQTAVKNEPIQQTQNTRSKSTQRDTNSKQIQLQNNAQQTQLPQKQANVKHEAQNQTRQQNQRSPSNLQPKQVVQASQSSNTQKQIKIQQNEVMTQSKKRGYQESLSQKQIGGKNQQQKNAPYQVKTKEEPKSQTCSSKQQRAQKDIDLDDLLSQKTVRRCTKSKAQLIKEEKIDVKATYTQVYQGRTKRQKISDLKVEKSRSKSAVMQDLSQITSKVNTRQSLSNTPKIQPDYYTQALPKTNGNTRSSKSRNQNLNTQISEKTSKTSNKASTKQSNQIIKIESDYDLSDLLNTSQRTTRTSQRHAKEVSLNQGTQRRGSKTATQTQKSIIEQQTQKSQRTYSRQQAKIAQQEVSSVSLHDTRSTRQTEQVAVSQRSKSPVASTSTAQHSKQKEATSSQKQNVQKTKPSQQIKKLEVSLVRNIVKIEEPTLLFEEQMDYEPITCSQLIEEIVPLKKQESYKDKQQVQTNQKSQERNQVSEKDLDEMILFSGVKCNIIQQLDQVKKESQSKVVIIQTQSDDEEMMEVDAIQYDADQSQAAFKYTEKYSIQDIKNNLQIRDAEQKKAQDILKLENELNKFERKQQKPVQQPIPQQELIKQRQYPIGLQRDGSSSKFTPPPITASNENIKRTPTSIYNHAPIAYIKEDKSTPSSLTRQVQQQQINQLRRTNLIEEEKKQNQSEIQGTVSQVDSHRTPQRALPDQVKLQITQNLITPETLDQVRRAFSNKATPSHSYVLNHSSSANAPIRYSSSNKRINSDKPTPCLDRKLNELNNSANIHGGVLLGSNTQLNFINLNQASNQNAVSEYSNIGNNGTLSRYGQGPQDNSMNNLNSSPRQGNHSFSLSNIQSEAITPYKERYDRANKEEEEKQQKISKQLKIEEVKQDQIKNTLNPEILTQKILEHSKKEQIIRKQAVQNIKQEQDTEMTDETQNKQKSLEQEALLKAKQLLNTISMSEKYSELLTLDTKIIQLALPAHYKSLMSLFCALDQTINFLRSRKLALTFTNIQKAVQQTMRKQFSQGNFAQIMFVAPFMYNHKWEARAKGFEIIVEIPKNIKLLLSKQERIPSEEAFEDMMVSDLLEKRKQYFQDRLLNITYQHYLKSKEQNKDIPKYHDLIQFIDPLTQNQWPVFFDLHEVPEIPKYQLKEQPKSVKSQTISEFINITNVNKQAKQIPDSFITAQEKAYDQKATPLLTVTTEKGKESPLVQLLTQDDGQQSVSTAVASNTTNQSGYSTSSRLLEAHMYLTQDLISKIKQKQNRIEYNKFLNKEHMERQDDEKYAENFTKIIKAISMQFVIRQTNTMPFKELLSVLDDKLRGQFNSKELLTDQINQLTQILPEWIQIISSPMGGQHLKMKNRKFQVPELSARVEVYLKSNQKSLNLSSTLIANNNSMTQQN